MLRNSYSAGLKPVLLLGLLAVALQPLQAQQTVGLFINDPASQPGYTLFAPNRYTETYLIDNAGREVHSWSSAEQPAFAAYFLESGELLRTSKAPNLGSMNAGGAGGRVEMLDWDSNLVWEFEYNSAEVRLHHDVEALPNGNVLMIAWELKTAAEAIAAGRNPDNLGNGELWPDHIIEVEPDGASGGTIVWEWHVWDHLVQDHDSTKANYGVIAEHPERIDINYYTNPNQASNADWNHVNGIDYNAELDQIVISSRFFHEFWVIDHSTTTAEAASSSGGNSGRGGDLLYRWGNPRAYGAGTEADQQFYGLHDARWIEPGRPGEGNILVFNNGGNRPDGSYSTVDEIVPPVDASGDYGTPAPGTAWGPQAPVWIYAADTPTDLYSRNVSGATRQPNGNTLLCAGSLGIFLEVSPDSEILWEYINPVVLAGPLQQGAAIPGGVLSRQNAVFKIERYAADYAGFAGQDLTPGDFIELPAFGGGSADYPLVDTGQDTCFDNSAPITPPATGAPFHGQDCQHQGNPPVYTDNGNGTVTDLVTGLMWQATTDQDGNGTIDVADKRSLDQALSEAAGLTLAGHTDWRVPTLKELYSLFLASGKDISGPDPQQFIPFLDTSYFEFGYGDTLAGERLIDAQYLSTTLYTGQTMNGDDSVFGVNFADGRVKGYPLVEPGGGEEDKLFYVQYVRGGADYGQNDFVDNGDGTITDLATARMWQLDDSGAALNWEEALALARQRNTEDYLGYDDWRVPDVKELQSIVDYGRSPQATGSPAIDSLFQSSQITDEGGNPNYPCYWSSTTHENETDGSWAMVVAFGEALGWIESPPESGNWVLLDVHGAGAQRADLKAGTPGDFPHGHGPQGDVVRVYNHVRLVRDLFPPSEDGITDLRISSGGPFIQLDWDAVAGALSYNVYVSDDPFDFPEDPAFSVPGSTWQGPNDGAAQRFYRVTVLR